MIYCEFVLRGLNGKCGWTLYHCRRRKSFTKSNLTKFYDFHQLLPHLLISVMYVSRSSLYAGFDSCEHCIFLQTNQSIYLADGTDFCIHLLIQPFFLPEAVLEKLNLLLPPLHSFLPLVIFSWNHFYSVFFFFLNSHANYHNVLFILAQFKLMLALFDNYFAIVVYQSTEMMN